MFEQLTEKINHAFRRLTGRGRLTPALVKASLREIKHALVDADVNYKVVKRFLKEVEHEATGKDVLKSITPAQKVIKVVHDKISELLGGEATSLKLPDDNPVIIMLAGLQGSGKTLTCAKLAHFYSKKGYKPVLVAMDIHRPAAAEQLEIVGEKTGTPVIIPDEKEGVVKLGKRAKKEALRNGWNLMILDTAGRHQLAEEMMNEIEDIDRHLKPHKTLLVLDAMVGQEAVNIVEGFRKCVDVDGFIVTKLDGDARGGAALSLSYATQLPIYFAGVGEKEDELEPFYPDRMANRILGMGDVVSFVEKAEQVYSEEESKKLEKKLKKGRINFDDLLEQMKAIQKMGSLDSLLGMLPGAGKLKGMKVDEKGLKKVEAMIYSMTPEERANPWIIDGSRKWRIAKGSGNSVQDVNRLLKQLDMMKKLTKSIGKGKLGGMLKGF